MAFVSGPRQSGKTTLARMMLERRATGGYENWDDVTFRRTWVKNPRAVIPKKGRGVPLVVLDEIHKARGWKGALKGVFDTLERRTDILVTGSARLNVYKEGGDSLLGRYLHFRLHPFSLRELEYEKPNSPGELLREISERSGLVKKSLGRDTEESLGVRFIPRTFPGARLQVRETLARWSH